ncbi:MAG: glycosyltransferase [Acidimicrobiia bacterium]|nr:glycosyltransferase [Acidimicrobiia bacterium]
MNIPASSVSQSAATPTRPTRVKLVTPDILGMVKNGGIGTACAHMAQVLARRGFDVSILFTHLALSRVTAGVEAARDRYQKLGVGFETLPELLSEELLGAKTLPGIPSLRESFLIYQALKDTDVDVLIFPEWQGTAFYPLLAKKEGLAFEKTSIIVQTHSSSLWHALNNQSSDYHPGMVGLFHTERESVRMADHVVSPTAYLADWKREHGFTFPESTRVLPLLLDETTPEIDPTPKPVDELVFFGRLEERKGLRYFLGAIDRLLRLEMIDDPTAVKVTFLGKFTKSPSTHVLDELLDKIESWPFKTSLVGTLDADEAQEYLNGEGRIAVIPSVADNSPLTVLENLYEQRPFLASKIGGIPEIVDSNFHDSHLFELTIPDLANSMARVLREGHGPALPAADQTKVAEEWDLFLSEAATAARGNAFPETTEPLVSLCLTHYNREAFLRTTITGLRRQDYPNFEVIITDDGSNDPSALAYLKELEGDTKLDVRVFHQKNLYVGAGRNLALSHARGDLIVFMDDDNYAEPNQISTFVKALQISGADALSCVARAFPHDDDPSLEGAETEWLYLPLGSGTSANIFGNFMGDANGIFRREALDAVGGFTEDHGLSWEDYELFVRLQVEGYETLAIPEPLFWLRSTKESVSRIGSMVPNHYRALRPYLEKLPWDTYGDAVLVGVARVLREEESVHMAKSSRKRAHKEFSEVMTTEDGTLANHRAVARYLKATGRGKQAFRVLWDAAHSADSARSLLFDWALLQADGKSISKRSLADEGDIHGEVAAHTLDLLRTSRWEPLAEALAEAHRLFPDHPTYAIHHGLFLAYRGEPYRALSLLGKAFDAAEAEYVGSNIDVYEGVANGFHINGISHYLVSGRDEARPWPESVTPVNLPARLVGDIEEYGPFSQVLNDLRHRTVHQNAAALASVWRKLIATDQLVDLVGISTLLLHQAQEGYRRENMDVDEAFLAGAVTDALEHWMSHGETEGRDYPLLEVRTLLRLSAPVEETEPVSAASRGGWKGHKRGN